MVLDDLETRLQAALSRSLPGAEAQRRMAPHPRSDHEQKAQVGVRRVAAVLILIYASRGEPHLVLTVRKSDLPHHRGQVALPGGEVEEGETLEAAALREAQEEVGVPPADARILGSLTPLHLSVSGFEVHPIVAVADRRPDLRGSDGEVARLLEIPLAELVDARCVRVEDRVPFFALGGERVWGATAMILAEFLGLLGIRPEPGLG